MYLIETTDTLIRGYFSQPMGVSPDNQTPHSWVTYKEEKTLPALHAIFSKFNASPLLDSNAKHMNIYMFPFRYGEHG